MPGYHQYVVEFLDEPADVADSATGSTRNLASRNADYQAHRSRGVGLPPPALMLARPGGFEGWMRRRGKLGGQNKVPRMDNTGALTRDLIRFLAESDLAGVAVPPQVCSLAHTTAP